MHTLQALSFVLFLASACEALDARRMRNMKNTGFINPRQLGGYSNFSFINSPSTKPEPLNVIISGLSDFPSNNASIEASRTRHRGSSVSSSYPAASSGAVNATTVFYERGGFSDWLNALNFSDECLGLHLSTPARAAVSNSTPALLNFLYREDFGKLDASFSGSCLETLNGGYHFRGFRQRQSGAWFLGASKEQNLTLAHNLVPDGYDLGRDEVVRRALIGGGKDSRNCTWPAAKLMKVRGILRPDDGGPSGLWNHDIGIDGVVKVLTVGKPVCP